MSTRKCQPCWGLADVPGCLSYHRRGDISTRTRASRDWAYEKLGPRSRLGICPRGRRRRDCRGHPLHPTLLDVFPKSDDVPDLVKRFRAYLSSSKRTLGLASINALYQLLQKEACTMWRIGGDTLVKVLFGMLEGVRNIITSWLQQTVAAGPSG